MRVIDISQEVLSCKVDAPMAVHKVLLSKDTVGLI